ncbi:unnamed protein product [Ophioblennius macclurei]
MNAAWGLLTVLSLVCHTESRCSPTSYYKNCWIRRFPGLLIDIEESQRRGAQLLKHYQEETALKCSRTCCLTRNFSCNLAIFHYDSNQENVNCFHLHCPTLESCILSHRGNVVLYNITKGVDPDLLVFGKYFTSNVRVLPHHYGRVNASEPLPLDKRQFVHPPPPAALPLTAAPSGKPSSTESGVHVNTAATSTAGLHGTGGSATTSTATAAALSSTKKPAPTSAASSVAPTFTTPPSSSSVHNAETPSTTTVHPFTSTSNRQDATTTHSQFASSPVVFTTSMGSIESTEQNPNDTKGSPGWNQTTSSEGVDAEDDAPAAGVGPGWHAAAHAVLVAAAAFVTVLLSCVCSILLLVSWRGQRKRMGRYRTTWRGKKGSMRLVKYVLVKENT